MTVKDVQDQTGLKMKELAEKAGMPLRTLEDWKRKGIDDYRINHLMAYIEKMGGVDDGRGQTSGIYT